MTEGDFLCKSSRVVNRFVFMGKKGEMVCTRIEKSPLKSSKILKHTIDAFFYWYRAELYHCARCVEWDKKFLLNNKRKEKNRRNISCLTHILTTLNIQVSSN